MEYYKDPDKQQGVHGYTLCGPRDSQNGPIGIDISENNGDHLERKGRIINVGRVQAYQTVWINNGGPGPERITTTRLAWQGNLISISLYSEKYIKEYNQILSSTHFFPTSSPDGTSDETENPGTYKGVNISP